MGSADTSPVSRNADDDARQHDMADGIADQRLAPQDQEVSGQGAGDAAKMPIRIGVSEN
jgi:hypothetical protein